MKRALIFLVALIAPLAWFGAMHVPRASACSGYGPEVTLLGAPVIVEGRVIELTKLPQDDPSSLLVPFRMVLTVERVHRGAEVGDRIATVLRLRVPDGTPVMCAESSTAYEGRYLVAGFRPGASGNHEFVAVSARGDGPQGPEYERGSRLAALIANSDPTLPRITLDPPSPACREPFRVDGVRFAPGKYVLRFPYESRVLGVAEVGEAGAFSVDTAFISPACNAADRSGWVTGIQVVSVDGNQGPGWLAETAAVTVAGAEDREPGYPTLAVTPSPARCGHPVTVSGSGFEPGELLAVGTAEAIEWGMDRHAVVSLKVDAHGAFTTAVMIPSDCRTRGLGPGSGYLEVWAKQAAYLDIPAMWMPLASATVWLPDGPIADAPGAPDLGSGLRGRSERGSWRVTSALAAATVAGAAAFAIYTWSLSRRRV